MDALTREQSLLADGLQKLRDLLGGVWDVQVREAAEGYVLPADVPRTAEALVNLVQSGGGGRSGQMLVEAETDLKPAEVERNLLPKLKLLRQITGEAPALVIAPWVSPRSRELLSSWGVGYLDLTGNVRLRLERLGIVVMTEGASRDPNPAKDSRRRLSGAKAGRLVRLLVDVAPPYRTSELAEVAGISVPYASRLLSAMEDMALIGRNGLSIVRVDWKGILRTRAEERSLMVSSPPVGMLALNGVEFTLNRLRDDLSLLEPIAVTGELAAAKVAPLAIGGQLMIYVTPEASEGGMAKLLGLTRVDRAADVLLLPASDQVVFERRRYVEGLPHVALSQLALDCLGGPGRLPEAGEVILNRMTSSEESWRLNNLEAATARRL